MWAQTSKLHGLQSRHSAAVHPSRHSLTWLAPIRPHYNMCCSDHMSHVPAPRPIPTPCQRSALPEGCCPVCSGQCADGTPAWYLALHTVHPAQAQAHCRNHTLYQAGLGKCSQDSTPLFLSSPPQPAAHCYCCLQQAAQTTPCRTCGAEPASPPAAHTADTCSCLHFHQPRAAPTPASSLFLQAAGALSLPIPPAACVHLLQ